MRCCCSHTLARARARPSANRRCAAHTAARAATEQGRTAPVVARAVPVAQDGATRRTEHVHDGDYAGRRRGRPYRRMALALRACRYSCYAGTAWRYHVAASRSSAPPEAMIRSYLRMVRVFRINTSSLMQKYGPMLRRNRAYRGPLAMAASPHARRARAARAQDGAGGRARRPGGSARRGAPPRARA